MTVTASDLYDYVHCPHRVTMDLVGDPSQRDPVSPFVELLWERGNAYESVVIERLSKTETIVDLSSYKEEDKEWRTLRTVRTMHYPTIGCRYSAYDDNPLTRRPPRAKMGTGASIAGWPGWPATLKWYQVDRTTPANEGTWPSKSVLFVGSLP